MDQFIDDFVGTDYPILTDNGGIFLPYKQKRGKAVDARCDLLLVTPASFGKQVREDRYGDFLCIDDLVKFITNVDQPLTSFSSSINLLVKHTTLCQQSAQ